MGGAAAATAPADGDGAFWGAFEFAGQGALAVLEAGAGWVLAADLFADHLLGHGSVPFVDGEAPGLVAGSEDSVGGVEVAEAAEVGREGRRERGRDGRGLRRGGGDGRVLAGGAGEFALEGGVFEQPAAVAGDGGFWVLVADVLLEVAALVERIERVIEAGAAVLLDGDALGLAVGVDADVDVERGDAGGVDADDGVAEEAAVACAGEDPDGLAEAAVGGGLGHDHGHVAEHGADGAGLLLLEVLDLGVACGEEEVERVRSGVGTGLALEDGAGVGRGGGEVFGGDAHEFDEGGIEAEVDLFERCAGGQ